MANRNIPLLVDFLANSNWETHSETRSDWDGYFRIGKLGPGSYRIRSRDYAHPGEISNVTLDTGMDATVDIPVIIDTFISGRIVDKDGQPIENAGVNAMTNQENRGMTSTSDEDGNYFVFGFLGPGSGFEVGVSKVGFALQLTENMNVPNGGLTGLDFGRPPESTLSETVVDPQSNPQGEVGLDLRPLYGSTSSVGHFSHCSGPDGSFTIPELGGGVYRIIAIIPGRNVSSLANEVAQIEAGRAEHIKDLVLVSYADGGMEITGTILDSLGHAMRSA